MSAKQQTQIEKAPKKKLSKRERKMRLYVYIMIIAMILSTVTVGLSGFLM